MTIGSTQLGVQKIVKAVSSNSAKPVHGWYDKPSQPEGKGYIGEYYPLLHIKPFFSDIAVQHRIKGVVVDGSAQSEHGIAVFFQPPSTGTLQPHVADELVR